MATALAPLRFVTPYHAHTLACVRRRLAAAAARESVADLVQFVQVDGAFAGAVLRVNSCPLYREDDEHNGPAVEAAVQRIAPDMLRRMVNALPVAAAPVSPEHAASASRNWVHSVAVAAACRWLANTGAFEDPDTAFLAGLLHDLGGGDPDVPAAQALECTSELLRSFALAAPLRHAVRFHAAVQRGMPAESIAVGGQPLPDGTRRLLVLLTRADLLATSLGFGDGKTVDELGTAIADTADASDAPAALESIELELRHAAALVGLDDVAPEDLAARLTDVELRIADAERDAAPQVERNAACIAGVHRRLMAARDRHSVLGVLERGLHEIAEGLGFGRLVLLDPDPSNDERLRARTVLDPSGLPLAGGLLGFEVPRVAGGAIDAVIRTGSPALVQERERDATTLDCFAVEQLLAARLSAGAAHFGVVAADQFFTGRPLTEGDAALLGLLCDTLGLVLQNAALDVQGETLRSLAEKDELTGINNRRNVVSILERELRRAERFGHSLSIALLDVDHFKKWNDTHGHQVGDVVLRGVAQLIAACSRDIDVFGRYGGEEFLVVLPETPLAHAVLYSERLRVSIETEAAEMFPQYAPSVLSVSIGVTSFRSGDNVDRIVQRADEALYAAKKYGRNRVCVEAGPAPADK